MGPELKQTQKLSMELRLTLQMQQTLKLLQVSKMELIQLIHQEIENNPLLEEKENLLSKPDEEGNGYETRDDSFFNNYENDYSTAPYEEETLKQIKYERHYDDYLNSRTEGPSFIGKAEEIPQDKDIRFSTDGAGKSLIEYLLEQLTIQDISEKDKEIAYHIIMNLDENGYLKGESEEENLVNIIAIKARASDEDVLRVLKIVQGFDPPGIAARNLKECLIIQARQMNFKNDLIIKAIEEHLHNFEKKRYEVIAKSLNITEEMARNIEKTIKNFNPKPGSSISDVQPEFIKPDVEVYKDSGEFKVRIIKEDIPKVNVNQIYLKEMKRRSRDPDSTYIRKNYKLAKIFITALNDREKRLKQVAEIIVRKQRDFFVRGEGNLKPLQEKDIAAELNLNVSTVSRIFNSKYIKTPFGVFPMKYFIKRTVISNEGGDVSNDLIKSMIKKMIDEEDPKYPLKDEEIARRLMRNNIEIKRRTVAKYRDALSIPPYNIRKRTKNLPK